MRAFNDKQEAAEAIKSAAKLYGWAKTGITFRDERWDYEPLYDPIDEKAYDMINRLLPNEPEMQKAA